MNFPRKGFGLLISCDIMKENKLYWKKNRICTRIIRAFSESEKKSLTTKEIFHLMLDQTNRHGAKYISNFTMQKVSQILNKYPFFEKVGMQYVKSAGNNGMQVCVWKVSKLGEEK